MDVLPNVTIDKITGNRFDKGQWDEFETELGEIIVEFKGTISQNLKNRVIDSIISDYEKLDYFTLLMRTTGHVSQLTNDDIQRLKAKYKKAADVESMEQGYYLEAVRIVVSRNMFKIGTPAIIQWAVNPKEEFFELTYLGSDAWKHIKDETFLIDLIFGR